MTDYDPRTDTGIPTEPVGSLPRPAKLQAAYAEYDAGNISKDDLEKLQDAAAKDSIERDGGDGLADHLRRRAALVVALRPIRSPTRWRARGWRPTSGRAGSSLRSSPTATAASCPSSPAAR